MTLHLVSGDDLLRAFDQLEEKREFARVEMVERRLERLVASASGFFRGAPGLFYQLVRAHDGAMSLRGRDRRWIVGDVHMENIGVIAIGHGKLVFDFNDLDEALEHSPSLDVLRGAASASIAAMDLGYGTKEALRAAEAFLVAYVRPLAAEVPRVVKALMDRAKERTPRELLDERCPTKGGSRSFLIGKRYLALRRDEKKVTEELFEVYAKKADLPWVQKKLHLEDAAFRVQGTGSLGVRRFVFLAREGKHGGQVLIEAKEMRKSAVEVGGLVHPKLPKTGEAGRVKRSMDALLHEALVGTLALRGADGRSYLMRLHAPGEDKLAITSLHGPNELVALARMIGYRLSQAHERAAGSPPPSIDPMKALVVALDLASAMTRTHLALAARAGTRGGKLAGG